MRRKLVKRGIRQKIKQDEDLSFEMISRFRIHQKPLGLIRAS